MTMAFSEFDAGALALLETAHEGPERKSAPTLWVRIDAASVGFASGVALSSRALRQRFRAVVGAPGGAALARAIAAVGGWRGERAERADDRLARVPARYHADHPRADLLRLERFQRRLRDLLPAHQFFVRELGGVS